MRAKYALPRLGVPWPRPTVRRAQATALRPGELLVRRVVSNGTARRCTGCGVTVYGLPRCPSCGLAS